jgi:hypothetical protein
VANKKILLFFAFILIINIMVPVCFGMSYIPFNNKPVLENITSAYYDTDGRTFYIRSTEAGQFGASWIPVWNKPGAYNHGAAIVRKVSNNTAVKVTRISSDKRWLFVKGVNENTLTGWCLSDHVFSD